MKIETKKQITNALITSMFAAIVSNIIDFDMGWKFYAVQASVFIAYFLGWFLNYNKE
jgi:hypothetical protein